MNNLQVRFRGMVMKKRNSGGFTLIELMVVVAIIAILAVIAYANYNRYSFRARRADAREMLQRVATAQERYNTNFNHYAPSLTAAPPAGLGLSTTTSEKGYYIVTTENGASGDAQSFKLTAAPQGVQQSDVCGDLTIDNTGYKTPVAPSSNGNCW